MKQPSPLDEQQKGSSMSSLPPYGYDPQNPQTYPPHGTTYPQQPAYQPAYQPVYPPPPAYPTPTGPTEYSPPPGPPSYPSGLGASGPAQPMYQVPVAPMMAYGYGVPVMPSPLLDPGRGQAITSLVLGIIGLVFAVIPVCGAPIAIILGIIGAVMGAIGQKSRTAHGMAIAGLVMSIIALVLSIGLFILIEATSTSP